MTILNTYIVRMAGVAIARVTADSPETAVAMVRSELQLDAIVPDAGAIEWVSVS